MCHLVDTFFKVNLALGAQLFTLSIIDTPLELMLFYFSDDTYILSDNMLNPQPFSTNSSGIVEGHQFVSGVNYILRLLLPSNTGTVRFTFTHFNIGRDFDFKDSSSQARAGAMINYNRYEICTKYYNNVHRTYRLSLLQGNN